MGREYDGIDESRREWIAAQSMFFVGTAPLAGDGHVNVSPKGFNGTFHIVDQNKVWYEDMSGSGMTTFSCANLYIRAHLIGSLGAETVAHLRENKRITVMFNAFEGPPRIVRLFGTGIFQATRNLQIFSSLKIQ